MKEELYGRLVDLLNEMESEGLAVNFGHRQGAETGWWSIPYVTNQRTCTIEVTWDKKKNKWRVGKP